MAPQQRLELRKLNRIIYCCWFYELLENIQYQILRLLFPRESERHQQPNYERNTNLATLMGEDLLAKVSGKVVIDFGCGTGNDAIEMVRRGAKRVIGVDIREDFLDTARRKARDAGLEGACEFTRTTPERADIVTSIDAFEHFSDPAAILDTMNSLLRPGGVVLISFGPTWYHPKGGHLFSVFPWAHLIFSENALIRWRSNFKSDGATRFNEVEGGLNQMTIAKFEHLVANSPLRLTKLETVPIGQLRFLHNRVTREFTTAIVRCQLVKLP